MENTIKKCVDFNIDLGRFFDENQKDKGLDLLDYASSVNIACFYNSVSPVPLINAMQNCKFRSKEIGALIALPDNIVDINSLSDEDIQAIILYQIGALSSLTKAHSLNIEHVRPCGFLYKLMSQNKDIAFSVAKAVKNFSEWLVLYGPSGTVIDEVASDLNINVAREVFLDKVYKRNGEIDFDSVLSDSIAHSLIRLRRFLNLSDVEVAENEYVKLDIDTIHFDVSTDNALELIKEANILVTPRPVNYNNVVTSGWVE